ncbi:sigma-E factor negative regulatory protein [Variovorax sp. PAMC 28711]|uniref:sigma-E factor negative regulatory protein n=1 Tax=Variovorax sp. PAMC 28711 TaxID=1795631 RepID=UPI002FFA2A47
MNTIPEQISALADGQLQGDEFAAVMRQLGEKSDLRATWRTYHVVGDVLRSGGHAPCSDGSAFLSKLQQRLAAEQIRPQSAAPSAPAPVTVAEAANEPVFRWKLVAGAASLAAAAAIGWTWVGMSSGASGAQLAQQEQRLQDPSRSVLAVAGSPTPTSALLSSTRVLVGKGAEAQVMLRDPRLDELLEAHQQVGGASQMPSGFLRNATFEAPSR